jgi:hypothetical protein
MIYDILLSTGDRINITNFLRENRNKNPLFRVIDIGAPSTYTDWSYELIDYVVDINDFKHDRIKSFKFNLNFESEWQRIFSFVDIHGKFDFCICSQTLEDIALPELTLRNLPKIAKAGYISVPSKFAELSNVLNQPWVGYMHHRWIFSIKNEKFIGLPKLNFIDHIEWLKIFQTSKSELYDLSFFWKDNIEFEIINNDYLGPTIDDAIKLYKIFLNDDITTVTSSH